MSIDTEAISYMLPQPSQRYQPGDLIRCDINTYYYYSDVVNFLTLKAEGKSFHHGSNILEVSNKPFYGVVHSTEIEFYSEADSYSTRRLTDVTTYIWTITTNSRIIVIIDNTKKYKLASQPTIIIS